jgi:hypothetical protein
MSENDRFGSIADEKVRSYVMANIKEMTSEVSLSLQALRNQPPKTRAAVRAAGELYSSSMLAGSRAKGIDLTKFTKKVKKGVWNVLCDISSDDKTKGLPDEKVKQIFDKDGIGTEIIEAAITAAFTALGSIWGGLGAAIGTVLGKKVEDWIIGFISSQLDEVAEKKLDRYCALVPTE